MATGNARKVEQTTAPADPHAQPVSLCKALYGVEWSEHMFLLCTRTYPKETSDGEPCAGGLPLIPYDGGVPDEIIRREYQRGLYRTQLVIQEPGKRCAFTPGSRIHMVEIPEGEPRIPRASAPPQQRAAAPRNSEESRLRDLIGQIQGSIKERAAAAPTTSERERDPLVRKLKRMVRAERAQRLQVEREREEERRAAREREERARDRAELAQMVTAGVQALSQSLDAKLGAIAALGDRLDAKIDDSTGSLLEQVEERLAEKLQGTDRVAMGLQMVERTFDRYSDSKKDEHTTLLDAKVRELEAHRAQLLTQLGAEQAEKQRLAAELKKRSGNA